MDNSKRRLAQVVQPVGTSVISGGSMMVSPSRPELRATQPAAADLWGESLAASRTSVPFNVKRGFGLSCEAGDSC